MIAPKLVPVLPIFVLLNQQWSVPNHHSTYNEKENISLVIQSIFSVVHAVDLLFVDDSSPDGTADEIAKFQTEYQIKSTCSPVQKGGLRKGLYWWI